MDNKQKIQGLFNDLTARFGKPELKDGQKGQVVFESWVSALGGYSQADLKAAVAGWVQEAKYPRWPEVAEMLAQLRSMGAYQEAKRNDDRPQHIKNAEADATAWYKWVTGTPSCHGYVSHAMIVDDLIGVGLAENIGKPFHILLTTAWLNGVIPNHWERMRDAFIEKAEANAKLYHKAIKEHGEVAVHERQVKWLGQ